MNDYRDPVAEREAAKCLDLLTTVQQSLDALTPERDRLVAKRDAIREAMRTRDVNIDECTRQIEVIETDIRAIENGYPTSTGSPAVWKLMEGKPGITSLERRIAQLRAEHAEWQRRATWNPDAKGQYRFVGRDANYTHPDGHRVMPGEVVELTNRQAENWRDLFEPVS